MKRILVFVVLLILLVPAHVFGEKPKAKPEFVVKFGTLAPGGTAWSSVLDTIKKFMEKESKGRIKIVFYMSGVMGDEPDMVRKMKMGQLQGGGFTFQGIHSFFPELMVTELPFLFEDYDEVDFVFKRIYTSLAKVLEKKGFILLALAEEGMQMIFSEKPVRKPEDFQQHRCWVWEDEPVQVETYKALGVSHPIPTTVLDLRPAFQNRMVNLVYASPMTIVGLQIYTGVKYGTLMNFRYNPALYLVTKSFWDSIPQEFRDLTKKAIDIMKDESYGKARPGQDEALKALSEYGIKIIVPTPEELNVLKKKTRPLWDDLADKVYPRWLLNEILSAKKAYAASKKK